MMPKDILKLLVSVPEEWNVAKYFEDFTEDSFGLIGILGKFIAFKHVDLLIVDYHIVKNIGDGSDHIQILSTFDQRFLNVHTLALCGDGDCIINIGDEVNWDEPRFWIQY
jgi:hypothetical protein